jgi:predicted DNA-binding transcriptional regulator AlpA
VTPSLVEKRTEAFYRWEVEGRGWRLYEHRVPIEPWFRPFRGHIVPAVLDDGHKPTFLSRAIATLKGSSTEVHGRLTEPEVEIPELPVFSWLEPVQEWDLLVPADERIHQAAVQEWLRTVLASRGPVSFELIGSARRVRLRIASGELDAARIRETTLAFFPAVSLRQPSNDLRFEWAAADGDVLGAMEFGLSREFMLPLGELPNGPLVPLLAALGRMEHGEIAVFQVLAAPTSAPWAAHALRAVTTPSGESFFADAPEVTNLAREKCAEPLYAVSVRVATRTMERASAEDLFLSVGGLVGGRGESIHNQLTPLVPDDLDALVDDIIGRTTRRSGMILSLSDVSTLVDLPDMRVRSDRLVRPSGRTKAAPVQRSGADVMLGMNEHEGVEREVRLQIEDRLRHCYLIGASGTGKSTLLLSMAIQDAVAGKGFAVLDPHGDLIEEIMARIPDERTDDVLLFDPADEEFPVGFNILSAHSELERTLLASDLVAVFRRLSTSFGDQMVTVLANSILAFLESDEGGTLLDLRRFLVEKAFRTQFLKTVRDREIVSYWQHEYPLLRGNPQAPLLTRLNAFLRPKLIRHMVAQNDDRFDMRAMMDGRKILLAKLSQGAIGEENSHLLGSLLVAKIAQAAMSRQNQPEAARVPFFLYVDEFHHFVTPSVAAILSGARKYGLGLTLAHQDMRQLRSRSEDVASAVLANALTRVVFRVSDQDARLLADGFSFFEARDLQNLGVGEAIARIERSESDFTLRTQPVPKVQETLAAARRDAVRSASRSHYATPRRTIAERLEEDRNVTNYEPSPAETVGRRSPRRAGMAAVPVEPATTGPGRGGPRHKYLQSLVKRIGEDHGFSATIEKVVLDGHGHIDVVLERGDLAIACEISISTRAEHEIQNLTKCLASGFDRAILICSESTTLSAARKGFPESTTPVSFLIPEELGAYLDRLGMENIPATRQPAPRVSRRLATDVPGRVIDVTPARSEPGRKQILIARDAAAYLGLAKQTLAKLRWAGTSPPYHKIGRKVVYDRADLDAWLVTRRRSNTASASLP